MATLNTSLSSEQGHSHALRQIFDKEQVQREINAQMAITRGAAETAKAIGTVASQQQAKALIAAAEAGKSADGTYKGKTAAQWQQEADSWGESGTYRIALHTALGVLTGGAVGAAGAAAAATAAQTLNQWESKIAEGLTNSGLPVAAGDGIAKALTGVLAGGVGYAAGGMAGAASGVNEDFNNRQLQETEKQLAKFLADRSGGRFTAKQIEDQLRAASRAMPGKQVENPGDGIVLTGAGSGQNAPVYTTRIVDGTGWVNNGTVVYQPVPAADREVIAYIRNVLGVNSPYSWSSETALRDTHLNPFAPASNGCLTAECSAGIPQGSKNTIDYLSVQGSYYVGSAGWTINLHDGTIYRNVGTTRSYPAPSSTPGFSITIGSLPGGATAAQTSEFIKGAGASGTYFAPMANPFLGIGGGVSTSYGGGAAVEFGLGSPGLSINPLNYAK